MRLLFVRTLLGVAGTICALGAAAHAAAYLSVARKALQQAGISPFFGAELQVLWLADSATLAGLAVIFGYLTVRPRAASPLLTMLIALLPAGTALLLYAFLGGFYAGHLLFLAATLALVAGALMFRLQRD